MPNFGLVKSRARKKKVEESVTRYARLGKEDKKN